MEVPLFWVFALLGTAAVYRWLGLGVQAVLGVLGVAWPFWACLPASGSPMRCDTP